MARRPRQVSAHPTTCMPPRRGPRAARRERPGRRHRRGSHYQKHRQAVAQRPVPAPARSNDPLGLFTELQSIRPSLPLQSRIPDQFPSNRREVQWVLRPLFLNLERPYQSLREGPGQEYEPENPEITTIDPRFFPSIPASVQGHAYKVNGFEVFIYTRPTTRLYRPCLVIPFEYSPEPAPSLRVSLTLPTPLINFISRFYKRDIIWKL